MSHRVVCASVLLLAVTSVAAIQAGGKPAGGKDGKDGKDGKPAPAAQQAPAPAPNAAQGIAVVLTKRLEDGPYEKSAYSFRYMTQDVAIHKNEVDVVYSACGQIHVQPNSGLKNKITKVPGMSLDEVQTWPNTGWMMSSIDAVKNQNYVMEIDDGTTKMRVKFRVSTLNAAELHLEWLPFRDMNAGLSGTLSKCTGKHATK
jgi:hypothetical protein